MKRFLLKLLSRKTLVSVMSVLLVCMLTGSTVLTTLYCADYSIEESVDEETDDETDEETEETTDESTDSTANSDISTEVTDEDSTAEELTEEDSGASVVDLLEETNEEVDVSDVDGEKEQEVESNTTYWTDVKSSFTLSSTSVNYISSAQELAYLAYLVNRNTGSKYAGYTFKLDANIDLTDYCWEPIGYVNASNSNNYSYFAGTFDGNGYTITGLHTYSSSDSYQGLFGYVRGSSSSEKALITNVVLLDATDEESNEYVQGKNYVGSVVGYAFYADITYCESSVEVYCTGTYGGGIVGCAYEYCYIEYCKNSGTVSASSSADYIGGICGYTYDYSIYIRYCANTASVSASSTSYCGGILGCSSNRTYIRFCYNTGSVISSYYVGGIVGCLTYHGGYGIINDCYNTGSVSATGYVGGIVGYMPNGDFTGIYRNYNTGSISGSSSYVGGIVGYLSGKSTSRIINCFNIGSVKTSADTNYVGGISGYCYYCSGCSYCYYRQDIVYKKSSTKYNHGIGAKDDATSYVERKSAAGLTNKLHLLGFYTRGDTNCPGWNSDYDWSVCDDTSSNYCSSSSFTWVLPNSTLRTSVSGNFYNTGYPILTWNAVYVTYTNSSLGETAKESIYTDVITYLASPDTFGWSVSTGDATTSVVNYYDGNTLLYTDSYTAQPSSTGSWNTSSSGTGTSYAFSAVHTFSSSFSLYQMNGSDGDSSRTVTLKTGSYAISESSTHGSGYTFIGWNTSNSPSASGWYRGGGSLSVSSGGTKTLYAQWVANSDYWTNNNSGSFAGGSGTSSNPYQISSEKELAWMAYKVNTDSSYASKSYILTADIDLSEHYWVPIGLNRTFTGSFNGAGHTISGLQMLCSSPYDTYYWNGSTIYMGLFAQSSGTIQNVIIRTITDGDAIQVGYGAAAYKQYSTTYIGGAVAYSEGSLSKVGVIGASSTDTTVKTIYVRYSTNVSFYAYAGGLIGYFQGDGTVDESFSSVVIYEENSLSYRYYGGFVGYANFTTDDDVQFSDCFSNYYIRSYSISYVYDGGFVGRASIDSYISNGNLTKFEMCYSRGTIDGRAAYAGGFVGYSSGYRYLISRGSYLRFSNCFSVSELDVSAQRKYGFGIYYNDYVSLSSCCYYSYSGESDSKASSSAGTYYFQNSNSSNTSKVYSWDITQSTTSMSSKTWICGQSSINNSYPMLTWCLALVTVVSNPSGLQDSISVANTSVPDLLTASSASGEGSSVVVFAGTAANCVVTKDSNLILDGWYYNDSRFSTSTSASYVATGFTSSASYTLTAKFTGVTITSQNLGAYLYNVNATDVASASGVGSVTFINSSDGTEVRTINFSSSSAPSFTAFDLMFANTYSVEVTPTLGYAYVSGVAMDEDSGTFDILSNKVSSSSSINGVNVGTRTLTLSGSSLYSSSDCASDGLKLYFIREVFEITYNVTDVSGTTIRGTTENGNLKYVTIVNPFASEYIKSSVGRYQKTLSGKITATYATVQDLFTVVSNAEVTHYFGVLWTLAYNNSTMLTFEDVEEAYKKSMTDEKSDYSDFELSNIITSNDSGPSFTLTLTATAIEYTLDSAEYTAGSSSTTGGTVGTATVNVRTTAALSGKFSVTTTKNYYLCYVRASKSFTYTDAGGYNTSSLNVNYIGSNSLGSGIIYSLIANYCVNNISTIVSNPSSSHSGTDYLKLIFDFEIGHYNLQIENDTGSSVSLSCYWDGSSSGTSVSISKEGKSTAKTLTLASSVNQKINVGSTALNVTCNSLLRAYKTTSSDLYEFYDSQTVTTSWDSGYYRYYQDEKLSGKGYENETYNTQTLILSLPTSSNHTYTSGTAVTPTNGVYKISSASNLQWVAYQVSQGNLLTSKFVQTCDIDLNSIDWAPIGTSSYAFAGTYDGGGYRILGLQVEAVATEESGLGLFGCTNGATIQNLTIDGGSVSGFSNVGAFVGYAVNTTLKNLNNYGCTISSNYGSVKVYSNWLSATTYTTKTVSGSNYAGVVGYASGCTITACCNNGGTTSVSYGSNVGGLVGTSTETIISECYSSNVGATLYGSADDCQISDVYWYDGGYVYITTNSNNWTTIGGTTVLKAFYW